MLFSTLFFQVSPCRFGIYNIAFFYSFVNALNCFLIIIGKLHISFPLSVVETIQNYYTFFLFITTRLRSFLTLFYIYFHAILYHSPMHHIAFNILFDFLLIPTYNNFISNCENC